MTGTLQKHESPMRFRLSTRERINQAFYRFTSVRPATVSNSPGSIGLGTCMMGSISSRLAIGGHLTRGKQSSYISAARIIRFADDQIDSTEIKAKHSDGCSVCNTALRDAIRGSTKRSAFEYLAQSLDGERSRHHS
jgi:hypothetical protein